jgi:hypothetical protein
MAVRNDGQPLDNKNLMERIVQLLASEAVEQIEDPHIVICADPATGVAAYSGPYENGLSALVAAARDHQLELNNDPSSRFEFSVAPCVRPTQDIG